MYMPCSLVCPSFMSVTRCAFSMLNLVLESICTDGEVLRQNIQMKLQGPDYQNMPAEEAMKDFLARTANYEKAYQTINDDEERDDIRYAYGVRSQ